MSQMIETLGQMQDYLDHFSYKPFARMFADKGEVLGTVEVVYMLPITDIVHGNKDMIQTFQAIPLPIEEKVMDMMIESAWRKLELHEMNEWLKKDDVCVTDPHPELKPEPIREGQYSIG